MSELYNRRCNFFAKMKENSVALLFAGVSKIASEDEAMPFVINKNFYYFTNIKQENSVIMFVKGALSQSVYLFVDEYNALKERWTGKRLTYDQAREISNIDNVYARSQLESMLDLALARDNNQYGRIDTLYIDQQPELKIGDLYTTRDYVYQLNDKYPYITVEDAYPMVRDLRMIKSSFEVEEIARAIARTNAGIANLINNLKPGMFEYELSDIFEYYGKSKYRTNLAFNTISAAGKNATCLHYPSQNDLVKEGQMVLFDLGYRHNEYCSDISRTLPVDGVYTGIQKEVYEAVLNVNKAVIEYIRAGMTIKQINDFATEQLRNEAITRGLMDKNDDIKKYYPHNVSHHLGLDTHDISLRERPLENGNVITVEPGLYFDQYQVGVRIEDDVVIMNGRAENLSKGIKKEIVDIERLFKTKGI